MRQSGVIEGQPAGSTSLDGSVDLVRDRDLVERCQHGDEAAFAELYGIYHRRLFRFCLRQLREPNDAEEAVQEAFTKAWRALARFDGERRFYPWLTVIAGNVCTDMQRRRARLVPMADVSLSAADTGVDDVDARLLRQVDMAMVTEALARLSERHQRVLRLREGAGWSSQRIAREEGVAAPAVDTLLWRARQAFKREFMALADSSRQLWAIAGLPLLLLRRASVRGLVHTAGRVIPRLSLPALPAARNRVVLAVSAALTGAALASGTVNLPNSRGAPLPTAATPTASGAKHLPAVGSLGQAGIGHATAVHPATVGGASAGGGKKQPEATGSTSTVGGSGVAGDVLPEPASSGSVPVAPSQASSALTTTLNSATGALTTTLHGATGALTTTLNSATGALTTTLNSATGALTTTLNSATGALTTTLNSATGALGPSTPASAGQPTGSPITSLANSAGNVVSALAGSGSASSTSGTSLLGLP